MDLICGYFDKGWYVTMINSGGVSELHMFVSNGALYNYTCPTNRLVIDMNLLITLKDREESVWKPVEKRRTSPIR